jgi:hypothetical protein
VIRTDMAVSAWVRATGLIGTVVLVVVVGATVVLLVLAARADPFWPGAVVGVVAAPARPGPARTAARTVATATAAAGPAVNAALKRRGISYSPWIEAG